MSADDLADLKNNYPSYVLYDIWVGIPELHLTLNTPKEEPVVELLMKNLLLDAKQGFDFVDAKVSLKELSIFDRISKSDLYPYLL